MQAIINEVSSHLIIRKWFNSGELYFNISFILDRLSLTFATLVNLIGLLTLRFAVNYLHREQGYQRFFMILCLFISAMLLIVLAGNAMLTFVGWEMAGVSSYLLIGYAIIAIPPQKMPIAPLSPTASAMPVWCWVCFWLSL